MGTTDFDALFKANFNSTTQYYLFAGILFTFAVKTPTIFLLILPILPVASLYFTPLTYVICVITIIYASLNTFRTVDIKELIAYSSVAHAAVYILEVFSNTIQGIEGAIFLGLGHGFVSLGLEICVGAVLYDRTHSRLITYYRGVAQRARF
ncbi:various chains-domain-containing protein [Tuber brumale]|nr:various chains-domain-containing protein [Tuber brumale]